MALFMTGGEVSQKHVSVRIGAVPNIYNPLTHTPPPPYTTNSVTSPAPTRWRTVPAAAYSARGRVQIGPT